MDRGHDEAIDGPAVAFAPPPRRMRRIVDWSLALALATLAAAVVAVWRGVEVRSALLAAGAAMAAFAGAPLLAADAFARALVAPIVAPICASLGFAAVLAATGCDRALARVLLGPAVRWPWLCVPAAALAAYLVNVAVPSQAGTAAVLGPLALPLLRAARVHAAHAAAAVLFGASFGGDLLSPGAQDVVAVTGATAAQARALQGHLLPASLVGLLVGTAWLTLRARRDAPAPTAPPANDATDLPPLRPVDLLRATVPLLPVGLLLAAQAGCAPLQWLLQPPTTGPADAWNGALAIVRAMLVGAAIAAATSWPTLRDGAARFFDGMGQAYAGVIALTVCAQVFGAGLAACGVASALLAATPAAAHGALCAAFPFGLSLLSGSGSGSVLASAQALLAGLPAGPDVDRGAAFACLGGAFGRTLSPAAAVVACVAGLARVEVVALLRAVAPPRLRGAAAAFATIALR
ncbi:MAG: C4-dicarboxylate transporter DcuC [Planctomycetota bacterium]